MNANRHLTDMQVLGPCGMDMRIYQIIFSFYTPA